MALLLRLRSFFVPALLAAVCVPAARAADDAAQPPAPSPAVQIPLEPLGYRPGMAAMTLRSGYANATVHFIDADHLLLTYTVRTLVRRLPDQRETDDDHVVRALVLHLPDGKVMRQTEWRLHDRSPYLWALPEGHFLFRVRNDLYTLDPLGSFDPAHLGQRPALQQEDELEALAFSPERNLLLMETAPPRKIGDDPTDGSSRPVHVTFLSVQILPDGAVLFGNRGRAEAKTSFSMSFTSMGVLESVREDRTHWGFDFHAFSGKKMELAGFTSTCRPTSIFVSDAEFFAFGCRGGNERKLMGGFNLLSDAKWVFTTDDEPFWLAVESSTATGRFALRNTLTTMGMEGIDRPDPGEVRGEEVRVYGNRDGEELLRVNTFPVQRPAGNFALSPDGLRLAIFQGDQLALYNLPPQSRADRSLHEKEQTALAPLRGAALGDVLSAIASPSGDDAP